MAFYLLVVFILLLIFHIVTRNNRRARLLSKIRGPTAYPIVGNLLIFLGCDKCDFWTVGRALMRKYYPITRYWILHTALVSVGHPGDLEAILTNQKANKKGYAYWYVHSWLKDGLLTSTGEHWRQRRRLLTPAFHFNILSKYVEISCEQAAKLIDELKREGDETVKSLIPFCSDHTLNIMCEAAMGVSLDKMDTQKVKQYKQAIHDMGTVIFYRLLRPYIANCMLPLVRRIHKLQNNALKVLHEFTNQVINERREYHRMTNNKHLIEDVNTIDDTDDNYLGIGRKRRLAMLDLLLAAEKNGLISSDGVKEEVDNFTFAGHDTCGMTMTYTLMLLAENKKDQDEARAEITEVLEKSNGTLGFSEIQKLECLDRCIKESLRLYPPAATIMRYTPEELQLENARVPADTHLMLHFWDAHRDPNFWSEPDSFNPDRFRPENSKNRHPFAYVPFSAGQRNCIGQKFAMMEIKTVIGRILYDFYLEPIDRTTDMKLTADIILRPLDPVHIKFIKINK